MNWTWKDKKFRPASILSVEGLQIGRICTPAGITAEGLMTGT